MLKSVKGIESEQAFKSDRIGLPFPVHDLDFSFTKHLIFGSESCNQHKSQKYFLLEAVSAYSRRAYTFDFSIKSYVTLIYFTLFMHKIKHCVFIFYLFIFQNGIDNFLIELIIELNNYFCNSCCLNMYV